MAGFKFKPARTTRTVVSQRGDIGNDRCRALVRGGKPAVSEENNGRLQGVRRKRLVAPSGIFTKISQGRRRTLVSPNSARKMAECLSACKPDLFSHAARTQAAGRGKPRIPRALEGSKARELVLGSILPRLSGRRARRPTSRDFGRIRNTWAYGRKGPRSPGQARRVERQLVLAEEKVGRRKWISPAPLA